MRTIEYDRAAPAPWKITTDHSTEWHPMVRHAGRRMCLRRRVTSVSIM